MFTGSTASFEMQSQHIGRRMTHHWLAGRELGASPDRRPSLIGTFGYLAVSQDSETHVAN
jgi:hypothetical protein